MTPEERAVEIARGLEEWLEYNAPGFNERVSQRRKCREFLTEAIRAAVAETRRKDAEIARDIRLPLHLRNDPETLRVRDRIADAIEAQS